MVGPIVGPDLERFFEDMEIDRNWEQTVPPAVLMQLGLQTGPASGGGGVPGGGTPGTGTPVGTPGGGTPGGGNPRGGGPGGGGGGEGQRINNVNFVSSLFQQFWEMTTITCNALKNQIRNNEKPALPLSKVKATKSICLPWHARGECNTRCSYCYDHVQYSADELGELHTWCEANFN